jgi:hypothetical protein
MVKRTWFINETEKRGGGGGTRGDCSAGGRWPKYSTGVSRRSCSPAQQAQSLEARAHRRTAEPQGRRGARRPVAGTSNGALTPYHMFHFQTRCSVLEQSPLLHPTAVTALIRTSPAAATDGAGVAETVEWRQEGAEPCVMDYALPSHFASSYWSPQVRPPIAVSSSAPGSACLSFGARWHRGRLSSHRAS